MDRSLGRIQLEKRLCIIIGLSTRLFTILYNREEPSTLVNKGKGQNIIKY